MRCVRCGRVKKLSYRRLCRTCETWASGKHVLRDYPVLDGGPEVDEAGIQVHLYCMCHQPALVRAEWFDATYCGRCGRATR